MQEDLIQIVVNIPESGKRRMPMKKIYMAGAAGMLGSAFQEVFSSDYIVKSTDIDINEPWVSYLDFRDYEAYLKDVVDLRPDYLFHLGALTDLEYCERHPQEAYATNTMAVENAVQICNKLDIPLLYISTAGIFDGAKNSYDDYDRPNPLGIYGRSKYAAECYVESHSKRHLICRAGWMMGSGPQKDKKFIQKLMKQIKDGAKTLHIVDDKLGTPTYTVDFAMNVRKLIDIEMWGLFNMACEGDASRLDVTNELLKIIGYTTRIEVIPVGSEYWKDEYFAERPRSERLINRRLDLRGLNCMRDWKVCLREYIDHHYSSYLE
jgi:dTDP-4-dehydrorhamnose reductase